jgi:DNA polymerase I-like protein with 3'-5' exonuclease and polymerase domains
MAKASKQTSVISKQLEEHIDVPFHVVGTSQWLEECIAPGVLNNEISTRVDCASDMVPVLQQLDKTTILGLDSETGGDNKRDGLDPVATTSRMLIFQLGTTKMVYLIEPALVPQLKAILEDQSKLFITQNGVHDFKFVLAKYGIHFINYTFNEATQTCVPCLYDTMLAEQLITAGLFGVSVGLEELAERYPPHYLISKAVRKEFIDMRGVLEWRHLHYAARDVFLLFNIYTGQLAEIKKHPGMWERMQLEFCAIPGTADAELTGFDLDEVRIGATLDYYRKKAKNIRDQCNQIYNDTLQAAGIKRNFLLPDAVETFDLDSASKKLDALLKMGIDIKDVKRETLLATGDLITTLLGSYSECTKVISTYGQGLLNRRSKTTGRLHPEFNQLGSGDIENRKGDKSTTIATGRWSSDAQQFPRPEHILDPVIGKEAEDIKSLFSNEYYNALEKLQGDTSAKE